MLIRIQPGTLREIQTGTNGNGFHATILRAPKQYAIVSGRFGTDSYKSIPVREGVYKRLCKQHRRRSGMLIISNGHVRITL